MFSNPVKSDGSCDLSIVKEVLKNLNNKTNHDLRKVVIDKNDCKAVT